MTGPTRGYYFGDGRQRRSNVERGEALPQTRANLLVSRGGEEVSTINKVLLEEKLSIL